MSKFVSKHMRKAPQVPSYLLEVNGFHVFSSRRDVVTTIGSDILSPNKLDMILNPSLIPTGKWIYKTTDKNEFTAVQNSIEKLKQNAMTRIYSKNIITKNQNHINSLNTASKFGIDSATVLVYDVPVGAGAEELHYVFENYPLKKGVVKVSSDNALSSFLIYFQSRSDAEKAVFEMNGSSFAGNYLHMHLYT
mmetsp:Transcript_5648/g.8587  ORF Transcript_5648/g.8587 Transcript_5648/m.8587 type:complete len:192 (+) Transcript_5648:58-633(+)